jgi:hypothetical protein
MGSIGTKFQKLRLMEWLGHCKNRSKVNKVCRDIVAIWGTPFLSERTVSGKS